MKGAWGAEQQECGLGQTLNTFTVYGASSHTFCNGGRKHRLSELHALLSEHIRLWFPDDTDCTRPVCPLLLQQSFGVPVSPGNVEDFTDPV